MTRILVTGGAGFIGRALCPALLRAGFEVSVATRNPRSAEKLRGVEIRPIPSVGAGTDWSAALRDVDAVVHMAARVHVMDDQAADPLTEFRRVNSEGTLKLAEDAALAGVGRFVYVSTIKVNGESTPTDRPFRADDEPAPRDPYGLSKLEAEQALWEVSEQTGMEVVALRPPLVYGPGVKGNFLTLMEKCARGSTLPLGAVHNRRSLVYVGNLADALLQCVIRPEAAGHTFLVSDGDDVSSTELLRRVAGALDRKPRLLPVPASFLKLGGLLTGKRAMVGRLLDSLVVDDSAIRDVLDWEPPFSMTEGLDATAEWFHTRHIR